MWWDYIVDWGLKPVQVKAGVIDAEGKAKYTGSTCFVTSMRPGVEAKGCRSRPSRPRLGHSTIAAQRNASESNRSISIRKRGFLVCALVDHTLRVPGGALLEFAEQRFLGALFRS